MDRFETLCGEYLLTLDTIETCQQEIATTYTVGVEETAAEVIINSSIVYLEKLDFLLFTRQCHLCGGLNDGGCQCSTNGY